MSFILESIKQAERERKLGQETPSISIEYTGAHVDDIENNKMKWALLSAVLFITAMVVWGTTYYFTNKDRQYMQQYVQERALSNLGVKEDQLQVSNSEIRQEDKSLEELVSKSTGNSKYDVVMVPVKNMHKSDLKSVRVINADEEAPKTKVEKIFVEKKPEANLLSNKNTALERKPTAIKPVLESVLRKTQPKTKTSAIADKQELAEIYSDLSKLVKAEAVNNKTKLAEEKVFEHNQVANERVQIETASYVVPEVDANHTKIVSQSAVTPVATKQSTKHAPKHAVRTGVPSFGELPYDIQERIPDFNVSVHMFHAEPNQRRIRINGNMYTEGKRLQQDLALVEITRYGAIFDYQGHKFRLNVR